MLDMHEVQADVREPASGAPRRSSVERRASAPAGLLRLQQHAGNRAVQGLLDRGNTPTVQCEAQASWSWRSSPPPLTELLPASATVRQQGTVESPTDWVFNGAISPSIAGNDAAVFYNRGGPSHLVLLGARSRTSTTPLGQLGVAELVLGTSSTTDRATAFGPCVAKVRSSHRLAGCALSSGGDVDANEVGYARGADRCPGDEYDLVAALDELPFQRCRGGRPGVDGAGAGSRREGRAGRGRVLPSWGGGGGAAQASWQGR
jgi:hypothetical protein